MISESLKTNTTLTRLDLGGDENEVKWTQSNRNRNRNRNTKESKWKKWK